MSLHLFGHSGSGVGHGQLEPAARSAVRAPRPRPPAARGPPSRAFPPSGMASRALSARLRAPARAATGAAMIGGSTPRRSTLSATSGPRARGRRSASPPSASRASTTCAATGACAREGEQPRRERGRPRGGLLAVLRAGASPGWPREALGAPWSSPAPMTIRRLLKSCAMAAAIGPSASIFWACWSWVERLRCSVTSRAATATSVPLALRTAS